MIKLTINIATLPDRDQTSVNEIIEIAPKWCEVNVDFSVGNLGDKRQIMLEKSNGTYVTVVDDDDSISKDYFDEILVGIEKNVDVISVPVKRFYNGKIDKINYSGAKNPKSTCDYMSHFCAIKKELALKSGYRSIGYGEDFDFSLGLKDLLKTAHYIKKPIYMQYYVDREKEYNQYTSFMDCEPRRTSGNMSLV